MKKLYVPLALLLVGAIVLARVISVRTSPRCFTGAFIADEPAKSDVAQFGREYGKKPFLVMVFVDWGKFVDEEVVRGAYSENSLLFVTLEPWRADEKAGIDYDKLLAGGYDGYIDEFAEKMKGIPRPVLIRFAHEMNGNWYPWSGVKIGRDKYIAVYRYVKNRFDKAGAENMRWVFSVNAEDVPAENNYFMMYYPGEKYADYIGIDGYNWGNTRAGAGWRSFADIFARRYGEITLETGKPVMITEFGSASGGGDKAEWIENAMSDIKKMKKIKAFVIFNVDKEADWSFPPHTECGKALKKALEDPYFKESGKL